MNKWKLKKLSGSSPRVRGKGPARRSRPQSPRIIPAGAGKRVDFFVRHCLFSDHPRGCGEKSSGLPMRSRWTGSSPRVRGKGAFVALRRGRAGIIPAGAGKSGQRPGALLEKRDHPRGCGEKPSRRKAAPPSTGSSPRVRGKAHLLSDGHEPPGIIPAGAGKSSRSRPPSARRPGSSPRVRGKGKPEDLHELVPGIIPAGAGKSCTCQSHVSTGQDHPRGCGEKPVYLGLKKGLVGSSPRVRGKAHPTAQATRRPRIIPAGAGKRCPSKEVSAGKADHPRGCGEKPRMAAQLLGVQGSSPRVRGKA